MSGTLYKFWPGQVIDAPNGDLYYSSAEWIGKGKEKKPKAKTGKQTIVPDKKSTK